MRPKLDPRLGRAPPPHLRLAAALAPAHGRRRGALRRPAPGDGASSQARGCEQAIVAEHRDERCEQRLFTPTAVNRPSSRSTSLSRRSALRLPPTLPAAAREPSRCPTPSPPPTPPCSGTSLSSQTSPARSVAGSPARAEPSRADSPPQCALRPAVSVRGHARLRALLVAPRARPRAAAPLRGHRPPRPLPPLGAPRHSPSQGGTCAESLTSRVLP